MTDTLKQSTEVPCHYSRYCNIDDGSIPTRQVEVIRKKDMNTFNDFLKTRFSRFARCLLTLSWAALAGGLPALAVTSTGLDLELYAGLSIKGPVGTVYSVEYVTDLAQTNNWRNVTFLQLLITNYLWFDPAAPATAR